ncbi:DUF4365 domain-containing protein [Sunxiuqinia elliptica]|uniref:DUF4365 domain-containing protein n=1 Tax=Sunxiuqinia elliptica TaxID=655355 RepID=A0A1I2MCX4_9BACT|nr:DUF4365 domain-containing protein [Sunxiuqinia elliptica]SFF88768.1 protein of unknown function [Sunxiuqinia elliptica]
MPTKIPENRLAIYQTSNSLKEAGSVKWLDMLFCRENVKANFEIDDKKPDIDGNFEILNNSRFDGRLEAQIKTYNSKSSRNKPTYLCDIKLINYARKNRLACVILFVVDSINEKSYWKYLSSSFIRSLILKPNQKKITIKFDEDEYVNAKNFNSCLKKWHSFYTVKNNGIFFENCSIEESIKNKKRISKFFRNISFSNIDKTEVIQIQKFIDRFNHQLDNDYNFIKRFYYQEMWKMGIAIGNYSKTSLSYVLYPIFYGTNDFIIKKVKLRTFADIDYLNEDPFIIASINNNQNSIIDGSSDIVMNHINEKIKDLIEHKKFLFLTPEICTEYIFDALKEKYRSWRINYQGSINLLKLRDYIESNYSSRIENRTLQTYSENKSNLSTLFQCIKYLLNNDIKEITNFYPLKTKDNENYIDSVYSKVKIIYKLLPSLFNSYLYYTFPSLASKINFWKGYDLISVNLRTNKNDIFLHIHYFTRTDEAAVAPKMIFTKNFEHELYDSFFTEPDCKLP